MNLGVRVKIPKCDTLHNSQQTEMCQVVYLDPNTQSYSHSTLSVYAAEEENRVCEGFYRGKATTTELCFYKIVLFLTLSVLHRGPSCPLAALLVYEGGPRSGPFPFLFEMESF